MYSRVQVRHEFLMSTELELQTSGLDSRVPMELVLDRFFHLMESVAPSLPGPSGVFNAYGRVYFDCGHVELAACECASPCILPSVVERQQILVKQVVDRMASEGCPLLLANNNYSGLLNSEAPTWGSHENYLAERHPSQFGELILPFLVTRIYAGAGGIEYPTGNFLAAVRPLQMVLPTGGGTTEQRAIHSTAREEHHMGAHPKRFRYHSILGDGHRSHFNLAIQFAATALALKAIFFVRRFPEQVLKLASQLMGRSWVDTLRRFNVLARPGEPWQVHPAGIAAQRLYLEGARRYAESLSSPPSWIAWALENWARMLEAFETRDLDWLSMRLDAFAKYRIYSSILDDQGKSWTDFPQEVELAHELTLLDQSYHSFCQSDSLFHRLEQAGLMDHRVGPYVGPGEEREPYVPGVATRADARARTIRAYAAERHHVLVDWAYIFDHRTSSSQRLEDPFAVGYTVAGPAEGASPDSYLF